jgi:hypothetical protein
MSQDQLAQAYARLKSLKENLPQAFEADSKYIEEYHQILDLLHNVSGSDLTSFKVPANMIYPQTSGGNYITGEVHYSGRKVCERSYLMMKIDGMLGFFSIVTAPKRKEFGFKAS